MRIMDFVISFIVIKFGKVKTVEDLGVSVGKNTKKICLLLDTESRLQGGKDSKTRLRTRADCRLKSNQKRTLTMNMMQGYVYVMHSFL
jgi:hypothetical protein